MQKPGTDNEFGCARCQNVKLLLTCCALVSKVLKCTRMWVCTVPKWLSCCPIVVPWLQKCWTVREFGCAPWCLGSVFPKASRAIGICRQTHPINKLFEQNTFEQCSCTCHRKQGWWCLHTWCRFANCSSCYARTPKKQQQQQQEQEQPQQQHCEGFDATKCVAHGGRHDYNVLVGSTATRASLPQAKND